MQYRRLGATGLQVSKVCLGMMSYGAPDWQSWVLPGDAGPRFVRMALDRGINFFDTADFYSFGQSEEILGQSIRDLTDRANVVIATKVGLPMAPNANRGGLSRKHIFASIDASLRRLQTDYVDLYQLHRADPATPIEETLEALHDVVKAGKALHVGASNFAAWDFARAVYTGRWQAGLRLSAMQLQLNLAYREDERDLLPLCRAEAIGVVVYSPLARGFLTGNRTEAATLTERERRRATGDAKAHTLYGSPGDRRVLDQLLQIAAARGLSPAQVAMAWVHHQPGISSVLCGALEESHLEDAVAAVDVNLTEDELSRLEAPYEPQPVKDDAFGSVQAVKHWAGPAMDKARDKR